MKLLQSVIQYFSHLSHKVISNSRDYIEVTETQWDPDSRRDVTVTTRKREGTPNTGIFIQVPKGSIAGIDDRCTLTDFPPVLSNKGLHDIVANSIEPIVLDPSLDYEPDSCGVTEKGGIWVLYSPIAQGGNALLGIMDEDGNPLDSSITE